MHIGIIGLKPRQVQDVKGRKFHGITLDFFDSDIKFTVDRMSSFSRGKDKVVIIQQLVPNHAMEGIPANLRHRMAGSVSTVIGYLNTIAQEIKAKEPKVETPAPQVVHKTTHAKKDTAVVKTHEKPLAKPAPVAPVVKEEPKASIGLSVTGLPAIDIKLEKPEPKLLASEVPDGRSSQYHLPKHDILINYPNSGGVMDYKILLATIPGDVLRFARPEGLNLTKWRNRVNATRYHYWRKHGLYIEAHFYNEYVDLQIMKQDEPVAQNTLAVTTTPYDPQFKHESRPMGSTLIVQHDTDGVPAPRMVPDGKGGWITEAEHAEREAAEQSTGTTHVINGIKVQDPDPEGKTGQWAMANEESASGPEFQFDEQAQTPAETASEPAPVLVETPVAEETPAVEPAPDRAIAMLFLGTPSEEAFWQQVYVAATAAGGTAFEATDKADKAVRNFRKRLPA